MGFLGFPSPPSGPPRGGRRASPALDAATTIPELADLLIGTVEPMPAEYHAGMLTEILQGWGMLPVGTRVVLPDGERVLLSQAGRRRVLHQQNRGKLPPDEPQPATGA